MIKHKVMPYCNHVVSGVSSFTGGCSYVTCTPLMTAQVTCHCLEQETVGYVLNATQQQLGHLRAYSCVFAFNLSGMTAGRDASPVQKGI